MHVDVARSGFGNEKYQIISVSDYFWKLRCAKIYAIVARNLFPNQNIYSAWGSDHLLTIRWRIDVEKMTPLWREAHFQVKDVKDWDFYLFLDNSMVIR